MRFLLLLCLAWNAAAFAQGCKLVKIEEWAVRQERGLPVIDGEINGQKIAILLDTGTASSFVTRAAANRLALTRYESGGIPDPRGGGTIETTRVEELKIGPAARRNWNLPVLGAIDFGSQVSLVLGADFFSQVDVEFDLPGKAVRLFQARDCEKVSLAYWAKGAAGEVPLAREAGIAFPVSINGHPLRALLDSGSEFSALDAAEAARMGMKAGAAGVAPAGCSFGVARKAIELWSGPFESFVIGDEKIGGPVLRFGDLFEKTAAAETGSRLQSEATGLPHMLLGADFLLAHRVLVARSQSRMYFTYAGGAVFPKGTAKACQDQK
jgi:predicted aspartyl protease